MRQFLSHIFSQIRSHKKVVLGGLAIALLFSVAPLQFAQANIFADIFGVISNLFLGWAFGIPIAIITAILYILALVAAWLGVVILAVLKIFLVASVSFPLLPGQSIEVVNFGWTLSRDLVNVVFILILVFIGLSTILRIQNYQLQKTLPALIIMAILVNFSGVFVSFIVDITNIFTNAFVSQLGTLDMGIEASKNLLESLVKGLAGVITNITDIGAIIIPAVKGAVYLGFFVIFTLVMFVVTLLMIVRVGILSALTILAPIAFAARILPATKNIWDQWLKQLIQWSLIGIPITFFLLLAQHAATGAENIREKFMIGFNVGELGGADPGLVNIIMDLTGPFIALLLVVMGVIVSMQLAPASANTVIKWGKKAGLATGGWAAREGWRNIARGKAIERFGANIRKRGQGIGVKAEEQTRVEKLMGGMGFIGKNRITALIGTGIEMGSKRANAGVKQRDEASIAASEKAVGKTKGAGIRRIREQLLKPRYPLQDDSSMVGDLTAEIKNGNVKGIRKAIKNGELDKKILTRLYKNTVANGNDEARELIERAFPDLAFDKKTPDGRLAEKNALGVSPEHQKGIVKNYSDKDVTDKILTADALFQHDANWEVKKNPDDSIMIDKEFVQRLLKEGNRRLLQRILEKGDPEETLALWGYIKELSAAGGLKELDREDILRWSKGNAARDLGIEEIEDLSGGGGGGGTPEGGTKKPGSRWKYGPGGFPIRTGEDTPPPGGGPAIPPGPTTPAGGGPTTGGGAAGGAAMGTPGASSTSTGGGSSTPPPPASATAKPKPQVDNFVHWVSGGIQMTPNPAKVLRIETGPDDKEYAFIEGISGGVPTDELEIQVPPTGGVNASVRRAAQGAGRGIAATGGAVARTTGSAVIKGMMAVGGAEDRVARAAVRGAVKVSGAAYKKAGSQVQKAIKRVAETKRINKLIKERSKKEEDLREKLLELEQMWGDKRPYELLDSERNAIDQLEHETSILRKNLSDIETKLKSSGVTPP